MEIKDEWTQEEFLKNKRQLAKEGVEVVLVDTILSPIAKAGVITYNPYEMKQYPKGTVFVFYCDTGKSTKERLSEYKEKFADYNCVSLKGGRGYWRVNMQLLDETDKDDK